MDLLKLVCNLDDEVTKVQPTNADGTNVVRRSLTCTKTVMVLIGQKKQMNDTMKI